MGSTQQSALMSAYRQKHVEDTITKEQRLWLCLYSYLYLAVTSSNRINI